MASLAALRLLNDREGLAHPRSTVQVYTFGQPRVGNPQYANAFNAAIESRQATLHGFTYRSAAYRVVNALDVVPHVPPCSGSMLLSHDECPNWAEGGCCDPAAPFTSYTYYHHSTEIWFPAGEYRFNGSDWILGDYRECVGEPYGEDQACSNSVATSIYSLGDHKLYWKNLKAGFSSCGYQPS